MVLELWTSTLDVVRVLLLRSVRATDRQTATEIDQEVISALVVPPAGPLKLNELACTGMGMHGIQQIKDWGLLAGRPGDLERLHLASCHVMS